MSLIDALAGGLEGYLGAEGVKDATRDLTAVSNRLEQDIRRQGSQSASNLAFKPVTVTSGVGNVGVDRGGNINIGLTPQGQAIQQGLQGQAQSLMGQAPVTQQDLFNQLQAAQAPELQRQRDSLESRLRAQGRLGLSSSAYGGSPEQLAFEKAAQEASAGNFFQAAQLAPQLQGQNISNIQNTLATSFLPQQQAQGLLSPLATFSQLGQAASTAQSEAQLKSLLEASGIQATTAGNIAELAAEQAKARAQAYGGLFSAIAPSAIRGLGQVAETGADLIGGVAGDALGGIIDFFSNNFGDDNVVANQVNAAS